MSHQSRNKTVLDANLDDWDTDPDFVHDIDEVSQRWGSKRTVGSINMNDLIDEVRQDHKAMREKFLHSSQRDSSAIPKGTNIGSKISKTTSSRDGDYDEYHESHTSSEISHKITKSSTIIKGPSGDNTQNVYGDRITREDSTSPRVVQTERVSPNPKYGANTANQTKSNFESRVDSASPFEKSSDKIKTSKSSSTSRTIHKDSGPNMEDNLPPGFKSIQDKIDSRFSEFEKNFEDFENRMRQRPELSKISTTTTKNVEKNTSSSSTSSNLEYTTRPSSGVPGNASYGSSSRSPPLIKTVTEIRSEAPTYSRSEFENTSNRGDLPQTSIKSLSERFESLGREESENFRKQTEAKRREFFDRIKSQVRETRKGLDGFDTREEEPNDPRHQSKSTSSKQYSSPTGTRQEAPKSPTRFSSKTSSEAGTNLSGSSSKPKIYTHRETTQECIVSKLVKENDKIIQDETKRNIERTSSDHGSSDEGQGDNQTLRYIDQELRPDKQSRQQDSPVERLKKQVSEMRPETRGAGLMARTLYDYQAVEGDELTFDVDDLITNIEKLDPGWYKGTITVKDGRKRIGLFPANYVKLLNDTSGEY